MGVEVAFTPSPHITPAVRSEAAVRALRRPDPMVETGFVMETVRLLRRELPPTVALIGFAGAPFTMAAYMVEGESSKNHLVLKELMFRESLVFHALMEKLSLVVIDYLNAQIEAGVQAVQLFDTWAGLLSPRDYAEYVQPHVRRIVETVGRRGVPVILYGNGAGGLLELMDETGPDVLGLDWRVDIRDVRRRLGRTRPLQGNLDPAVLYAPVDVIRERARGILEDAGTAHIFNLGHGITPDTPVEGVAELVRFVHEESRRLRTVPDQAR
jgi:uroporphyrinogen decarboxylase